MFIAFNADNTRRFYEFGLQWNFIFITKERKLYCREKYHASIFMLKVINEQQSIVFLIRSDPLPVVCNFLFFRFFQLKML